MQDTCHATSAKKSLDYPHQSVHNPQAQTTVKKWHNYYKFLHIFKVGR